MSDQHAIELAGVSKRYWKLEEPAMLLSAWLPFGRPTRSELWALRDVDLTIGRGETVGILGRNGAGKTTMMRLLAGVSQPTSGLVTVNGRIAPLISVGVGFHHEMSGRENVYVNGMLLGLTKDEVEDRFDDIVAFAELEEFIDTPVKFYSSGMFMRLGFSVAIHGDPDVLLVDEVLAVGDVAFQLKCLDRMREIQQRGTTIVLVSHSVHVIRLLCPRAVLMRHGEVVFDGDADVAVGRHYELMSTERESQPGEHAPVVRVVDRQLLGPDGPTFRPDQTEPVAYRAKLRFGEPIDSPMVWFRVVDEMGILAYGHHTVLSKEWRRFEAGDVAEVDIDFQPRLGGGTYRLQLGVSDQYGRESYYQESEGLLVYVAPRIGTKGAADLEATISVDGQPLSDHGDLVLAPKPDDPSGDSTDTRRVTGF